MRTCSEPGNFFAETSQEQKALFGLTASDSNDLALHVVDNGEGHSMSVQLSPENLDELEAFIGLYRAWMRSEVRSRPAEHTSASWVGHRNNRTLATA